VIILDRKNYIHEFIIEKNASVADAMSKINNNAGVSLLLCEKGVLSGVVSDGDIRRYIIDGGDINANISNVANYKPYVVKTNTKTISRVEYEEAKQLINTYGLTIVPIVDEDGMIIDVVCVKEKITNTKTLLNIPVVIMAGGKGTRLAPYTQILPKPLIPIGDKTITEHIMDRFEEYGCSHFDMILNYKKEFIKAYFSDEENYRDVDFVDEDKFMGTAGGLALVEGKYDGNIFVSNCDILIEADYSEIVRKHVEEENLITVVCAHKKNVIPYGTLETDKSGHIVSFKEKPVFEFLTNTGMYLIKAEFLNKIPKDTFIHITDVIEQCIADGERVGTYCVDEDAWMDMGQLEELERMRARIE